MRYIQLKNKILKLENNVRFLIFNNRNKNLAAQIQYSNDWLDCYMDLQALRGKLQLDEDKDPLYTKLRQIRKELAYIRG